MLLGEWESSSGDVNQLRNLLFTPQLVAVEGEWERTGQDTQTSVLEDAATHLHRYKHASAAVSEIGHSQYAQWGEGAGTCSMTEARPDGIVLTSMEQGRS